MLLILELAMFVGGIIALIRGKIKLGKRTAEGSQARIASMFLIIPLPIAVVIGFCLGVMSGLGIIPGGTGLLILSTVIEITLMIIGYAVASSLIKNAPQLSNVAAYQQPVYPNYPQQGYQNQPQQGYPQQYGYQQQPYPQQQYPAQGQQQGYYQQQQPPQQ